MNLFENAFIKKYVEESVDNLSILYPTLSREYLEHFVKQEAAKSCIDHPALIQNSYTKMNSQTTMLSLAHWIETKNPIIAGNGSFYVQHSESTAPANQMLIHQKKQRGVLKDKALECRVAGDLDGYHSNWLGQGNEKIKMNSYYGAMGQKNSFQYNVSAAGAITAQGRSIISTTTWFNESFLANNIIFDTFDDIVHYMKLILREEIHLERFKYISYVPTTKELVEYLMNHYESNESRVLYSGMLMYAIDRMTDAQKIKIYYKNNLMVLMDKNEGFREHVLSLVESPVQYLNPYEIPKEFHEPFDILWDLIEEFVFMKEYIMYNKVDKYVHHTRKNVMYSDTDSVFIYTGEWVFKIIEYLTGTKLEDIKMSELQKDQPKILKIINILTNIIYIGIHKVYDTLCNNVHICNEYKKFISIKNEFLFDRFIMFDIKKNYIYREIVNEGKILNPPNVGVKGGNLNPKAKNKLVTNRITEIVNEVTMKYDKIFPELLLQRIYEFRDEIVASLARGEINYLIPTKVKTPDQYANPYGQFKFVGVEVYRLATNDVTVHLPGSFNVVDVKITGLEALECIREQFPEIYEGFRDRVFKDEKLCKRELGYICLPMKFEAIPGWVVPFIDYDSIWRKHVNPLISLLPSLGVKHDNIKANTYYSTVLNI